MFRLTFYPFALFKSTLEIFGKVIWLCKLSLLTENLDQCLLAPAQSSCIALFLMSQHEN